MGRGPIGRGEMSALSGKYVLLIEDEALISLELTDLLNAYGAKVVGPTCDIAAALSFIQSTAIDCAGPADAHCRV